MFNYIIFPVALNSRVLELFFVYRMLNFVFTLGFTSSPPRGLNSKIFQQDLASWPLSLRLSGVKFIRLFCP